VARALSPVVGVALLVACVALLCTVVGTMALAYEPLDPASRVVVGATVDAGSNEITLTLEHGGPLDVRELSLLVEIDGEALEKQPPVPFVGATGFSTPSGPFNAAADPRWERGESAVLPIAGTNDPLPEPGSKVTIRLFENELPIAVAETTAG
jgi:archaeal type IV pilus assembly protein PilA